MELTLEIIMLILDRTRTIKVNFMPVLGMVLLGYDYLLTLDREVSLIWSSHWNLAKVLFILVRYTPYIDVGLIAFYMTRDGTSSTTCSLLYKSNSWVYVVGVGLAEVLLTLRTWACWGSRARWVTIGLPIAFLALSVTLCVSVGRYLHTLYFFTPPPTTPSLGCFYQGESFDLVICWSALMIYDACIALLMAIRGYPELKNWRRNMRNNTLSTVVYRDGLSLINVVVILCLSYDYVNLLSTFERVMYSILTCRAILDIRAQNQSDLRSLGITVSNH
ncbi:hypothetical protein K443DRAFT_132444 [Laccaria amethystina LaAM-08-1]|uniref:DUF6533 domain-containing protein n=1 Tax=Laccaria amethystina LaAM-08-1 TaxID=1095629 RepID=A0A0C9XHT3_9AGAR|nr:hypothetical protein K443DRAFT_132444 [Laccaria amethystina LaAM-08-1]